MQYKEQYKHPNWQKKRLEIMERDGFQCQACFSRDYELHVHHKYYEKGKKVWEYEDDCLITLCDDCHNTLHLNYNNIDRNTTLLDYIEIGCRSNYTDYWLLIQRINQIHEKDGFITNAIKTPLQLLTAYIIKLEDI